MQTMPDELSSQFFGIQLPHEGKLFPLRNRTANNGIQLFQKRQSWKSDLYQALIFLFINWSEILWD